LNLALSCLAALQAPVIIMSQNRQAARDRLDAQHDYEVNTKAEMEIKHRQFDRSVASRSSRVAVARQIYDLTSSNKARITKEFARHQDAMDRVAHGLSKAERGTLIALLRKLGTTAERQFSEGDTHHDDHPNS